MDQLDERAEMVGPCQDALKHCCQSWTSAATGVVDQMTGDAVVGAGEYWQLETDEQEWYRPRIQFLTGKVVDRLRH